MLRARDCYSRPVRGAARGLEELCACPPTAPLDSYTYAARYAGEVAAERKACAYVRTRQNTCAYVRIRAHTSAYVRIRQHTTAVCRGSGHSSGHRRSGIRQQTSAYVNILAIAAGADIVPSGIRQHVSAYVSIRENT
jgi:hypothetical protein